jgi:hypothetical protein
MPTVDAKVEIALDEAATRELAAASFHFWLRERASLPESEHGKEAWKV